ncbi:50S ribosomal protein L29 [Candidatus Kuenenbacteria bacterium RIFCSPHIGHO2_02_FULL_39_13]|uniref:Large ribosomal subunit protein uL29 n=1 Tax=Candidatus Kuenenbacteria bacterium RIFCSPHIGHO2_02_FULL_39_13 TaxID=1798561 RepID=A0A1F6FNY6_9BACT|nr:MAG: 50S ribosomal protein L29 [Candidatus Kuenenbacteria bacterium RIFCSPHIGHO2_02_FULL_39_13]
MKVKELNVKQITELKTLLSEKREALRNIRFKVAQRQLKKVHDIKAVKRDIARILTIIKQKSYEK